jgi:hypothetical protein
MVDRGETTKFTVFCPILNTIILSNLVWATAARSAEKFTRGARSPLPTQKDLLTTRSPYLRLSRSTKSKIRLTLLKELDIA